MEDPLLLRSAEIMRRLAENYCGGTDWTDDCRRYHGWWQYWRLIGLVVTPDWHGGNYADLFRSHIDDREFRVLVSGTADYGILRHLVQAMPPGTQRRVRIAVLDLCRTPLKVCSWYALENSADVAPRLSFHCGDVLQSPFRDGTFDLITTYAFLAWFPDPVKTRILAEWHRKLRPGGRVITTARLAKPTPSVKLEPNELSRRVVERMVGEEPQLRRVSDILGQIAAEYARASVGPYGPYPLPSVESIHSLFDGFDVAVDIGTLQGRFENNSRRYALITAMKR
jgi:SAM-dependent methyltransferase